MVINKKQESKYDCIKTKFAFFPTQINNEYIWLERYYTIRIQTMFSPFEFILRFRTREEAEHAVDMSLRNDI